MTKQYATYSDQKIYTINIYDDGEFEFAILNGSHQGSASICGISVWLERNGEEAKLTRDIWQYERSPLTKKYEFIHHRYTKPESLPQKETNELLEKVNILKNIPEAERATTIIATVQKVHAQFT